MSSKLKPNNKKKSTQNSASRIRFWSIILVAGVLVVATVLILIRMGVFESDEIDPVGRYELARMTDPSGVTTPVEQMKSATEMLEPGQALIEIELKADGTYTFTPNFDMMVYYGGRYEVEGSSITMTADEDDSGPVKGTIDSRFLTITDAEGYKMTFQKVS